MRRAAQNVSRGTVTVGGGAGKVALVKLKGKGGGGGPVEKDMLDVDIGVMGWAFIITEVTTPQVPALRFRKVYQIRKLLVEKLTSSTTSNRKEEILVIILVNVDKLPISRYHLDRKDVISSQAVQRSKHRMAASLHESTYTTNRRPSRKHNSNIIRRHKRMNLIRLKPRSQPSSFPFIISNLKIGDEFGGFEIMSPNTECSTTC